MLTTEQVIARHPAPPGKPLCYGEFWMSPQERAADRDEWALLWVRVIARDGKRCFYCKRIEWTRTLDHVVPRIRGGSNHLSNLRVACETCNKAKDATLPNVGVHTCRYPDVEPVAGPLAPLCYECLTPRSKQGRKAAHLARARAAAGEHACVYEPPDDPDALCTVCAVGLSKGARKRLNKRLRKAD